MNGFQCISFGIPDVRESILLCAFTIVGSGVISTSETQIHFVRVVMIDANKLFMGEYDITVNFQVSSLPECLQVAVEFQLNTVRQSN